MPFNKENEKYEENLSKLKEMLHNEETKELELKAINDTYWKVYNSYDYNNL